MTIKVEREALLRVLSRAPSFPKSAWCDSSSSSLIPDEEFVMVELPQPPCSFSDDNLVERLRDSYSDDDCCTVTSVSTSSFSETDERRVSFADPLVTAEWTRPWTPIEDREKLFYSMEETQRFRQEYRLERKLLADLEVGADGLPVNEEDFSNLLASASATSKQAHRHRISRVVVLHNDRFETFVHPEATGALSPKDAPTSDVFFDNDSFWSGSITWY